MGKIIPVSKPSITSKELAYAKDALKSGWISSQGPYIEKFENAWANFNGIEYGASCNSGTNALFLALKAIGIQKGDEVIVPEFTMVATAWAVTYCGATPVFVDCLDDLTMDPNKISQAITWKTRAIMPTAIYGRAPSQKIYEMARTHNLFIVEDLAEGHGIKPRGDIACYSFFGNKILTTGEGGMCITNDEKIHAKIQYLKAMAFNSNHTFLHNELGYNFRMTNVQAAIGLAQVERFEELIKKRNQIISWYDELIPEHYQMSKRDVPWVYDIDCGKNQEEIRAHLEEKGVQTRYFFKPMSQQSMYEGHYKGLNAYEWSNRGIYLPLFPDMKKSDVEYICKFL